MKISCASFGLLSDGREAVIYTLENGAVKVQLTNYGAAIVSLVVADRGGKAVDVVLGCDTAADYERQTACLGATPGRHANRIGKGVFTLQQVLLPLC